MRYVGPTSLGVSYQVTLMPEERKLNVNATALPRVGEMMDVDDEERPRTVTDVRWHLDPEGRQLAVTVEVTA
jgi:hypothetical protein